MDTTLKIIKTENSRLGDFDFNNMPGFGNAFSDHMFEADFIDGEWKNFTIRPLSNFSIHPANLTLHYGQAIFEGMKASLSKEGTPFIFRPFDHAKRLNMSAARMSMPSFPEDVFVDVLEKLIMIDKDWIPPMEGSAMYIRPFMFAMDGLIGVKPSQTYKFMILLLPVGAYYNKPLYLKVETEYVRAVRGGIGEAKAAGNYAASLYPYVEAKKEGFDQVLWLDAIELKYVQEISTMNIFFVLKDKVITPALDGALLKGITRDCFIKILKSKNIPIEETKINIYEIFELYKKGELLEVFGAGTAAIVANVDRLSLKGEVIQLDVSKYTISPMIMSTINKIRSGEYPDDFGWLKPVVQEVFA